MKFGRGIGVTDRFNAVSPYKQREQRDQRKSRGTTGGQLNAGTEAGIFGGGADREERKLEKLAGATWDGLTYDVKGTGSGFQPGLANTHACLYSWTCGRHH